MQVWMRRFLLGVATALLAGSSALPALASAQAPSLGDFSLQITPSPLVATVKPGQTTTLELKVHNGGSQPEQLKIEPRRFTLNNKTETVQLDDAAPPEIAPWISFSAPNFTIAPGQWFTEHVSLAIPKEAGFSYAFVLLISRKNAVPQLTEGGRALKGAIALFTLINIDRPGAARKLEVVRFTSVKHIYEYLPAEFDIQFKNTGNTIVLPAGNVFIQRGATDASPLNTLPVNRTGGYILPNAARTLHTNWDEGFPVYKTTLGDDGREHRQLVWDGANISKIRIGRYTAKLIAIYNDGQRDVPVEATVSFWVLPWKILTGLGVMVLLILFGLWSIIRKTGRVVRRRRRQKPTDKPKADNT